MPDSNAVIELRNITKLFPGVKALEDVNFSAKSGEVHAICGENGAGKSTLMKIINGIYKPDTGSIYIKGQEVRINSPLDARKHGIAMVYQECAFVPEMTVEESLFLGELPTTRLRNVDWKYVKKRTKEMLDKEQMITVSDLKEGMKTKLKELSLANIQLLEITKSISKDVEIIIMDEPTSSLAQHESGVLLNKIVELKKRGKCILYISHKMDEIFRIADTITVFRDGKVVGSKPAVDLNIDQVISMMVGRELVNDYPKHEVKIGPPILEVKNLHSPGVFSDISFTVHSGEIVGFAGLVGAGRTDVALALSGLTQVKSGTVEVSGKPVSIKNVNDSIKNNIAMLSEDRRKYGLVLVRDVKENISLPNLKKFIYRGRLHRKLENKAIISQCESIKIKTPSTDTPVENLSGGNQQKVVLAKWLLKDSSVMVLDEPTRGIDVGAKFEIYKLMMEMAKQGKGLLMISSEMPELLGMCDRIYVMAKGRIVKDFKRSDFSQEMIMHYATGSKN